ncbi:MAG: AsmA-like C-terminal region-containing protein [Bacteroidota bacterium]|nr:AsmA-like C-terminal region-containing protein [Bacteroidota bacterium]
MNKRKKILKRLLISFFLAPLFLVTTLVIVLYYKQDGLVQHLITELNADFNGSVEIKDSHISLFENFPYISIDLEEVKVYEDKTHNSKIIVDVDDLYVGFDLWTILTGKMEIKKIELKSGSLNLVQHLDGEFNITKALSSKKDIPNPSEEFHLDLKSVDLIDIDLTKYNEENKILLDAFISSAKSKFKTAPHHVYAFLDAKFMLNLVKDGDTTFIKHKHFFVNTELDFFTEKQVLTISPTIVHLEDSEFNMEGSIDFLNDVYLDLKLKGNKPNFNLFMAMAPEELQPAMKQYDNKGKIYFDLTIKGESINHHNPSINAKFGCSDAYISNTSVHKKLDDLNFVGYFTNGEKRNASTMEFGILDFRARPEAGLFKGKLVVKNFDSPEIITEVSTDFQLDFLAKFLNLEGFEDLKGKIELTMKFNDIIDIEHPEKSLEKLNQAYYLKLKVDKLSFKSKDFPIPIKQMDLMAEMNGKEAELDYFKILVGNSDLNISGTLNNLPALLHHTDIPVLTKLNISSKYLDLYQLTGSDSLKSFNEQIENLSLALEFKSSAKAFTESKHLPNGEFFIDNLYAKLKHYPHVLHDFHADLFVEENQFKVVDFSGNIDKSDFHFNGKIQNYAVLMDSISRGNSIIDFNLNSNHLELHDLFSYKGENFVPIDYRHEEFKNLKFHGILKVKFQDSLVGVALDLDKFDAKMKIHPFRFENFNGKIHYENDHLVVDNFSGKLGSSDFKTTLHYYLGKDEQIKKRDNHFEITSNRLDFDELFSYHPIPSSANKVDHDSVFNIYDIPFTDMTYHLNIGHLKYHKYLIDNIKGNLRTTKKHYLYLERLNLDAAGGHFDIGGYFNGSNPHLIYFSPDMKIKDVDLDKLLFKFDNFGQDHLVSENIHGKFTGTITGKIHMHTDLVPKIDDSEIHVDASITHGKLENYELLNSMADYFCDKNIKKVAFDTLDNHLDLTKGILTIPNMKINSSLGCFQISGKQDLNMNMEYYLKVPWKMVTKAAASKLFGKKQEEIDPEKEDEIEQANANTKYVNMKISGNPDDMKFSLKKEKVK